MATESIKGSEKKKVQKQRLEVLDVKPRKDAKGGSDYRFHNAWPRK